MAFQVVDDLLDYKGEAKATGKNIGDDFRERKLTLPVIRAIAQADANETAFWKRTIEKGQQGDGDLDEALRLLDKHGTLDSTRETALNWANKAKSAMDVVPDHDLRDMLVDLADFVVDRVN